MARHDILVIEPKHRGKEWIVKRPRSEYGIHIADSIDEAIAYVRLHAPDAEIRIKDLTGGFALLTRVTE
jgi:hypothetical protein